MHYCNSRFFKGLCLIVLVNVLLFSVGNEIVLAQAMKKTIPAGTPVIIRIDQEVSSKTTTAGAKVPATVVGDVFVGGEVVIRAGAICDVMVISARKGAAVGQAGEITLQINSVMAIDGTMIPISGSSLSKTGDSQLTTVLVLAILCCILALLLKGKDGVIAAGTQVTGHTLTAVEITM